VDNFPRPKADDDLISRNINSVFKTPNGIAVLKYLRSITIESVQGPNASDAELRHLRGSGICGSLRGVLIMDKR